MQIEVHCLFQIDYGTEVVFQTCICKVVELPGEPKPGSYIKLTDFLEIGMKSPYLVKSVLHIEDAEFVHLHIEEISYPSKIQRLEKELLQRGWEVCTAPREN